MPYEALDQNRLRQALRRLGDLAVAEGVELELSLYGGAVFTLVYGSRDSTKDVDGIIRPTEVGRKLAAEVAREQGLPDDWLNGDVAQFLAEREERRPYPKDDLGPGLVVTIPTAAYLLALKLRACRPPFARLPGRCARHPFSPRQNKTLFARGSGNALRPLFPARRAHRPRA